MPNEGPQPQISSEFGASVRALAEGQKVFGRYTLIRIVGCGNTSVVWLAWDEREKRDTVLKFLPEITKDDSSALAVLKSETRKASEVSHAQIVKFYEMEQEGKLLALATEYVEGATLSEMRAAKKNEILSATELAEWLKQLGAVFNYAHVEAQAVHGQLTPSKLIATKKGVLRLSDFGYAQRVSEFVQKTTAIDARKFILPYLSPQQAAGNPATALDDVYSLGACLYEVLTSKPPFYSGDIMLQVNEKVPPPMTTRRKDLRKIGEPIPRAWEETVAACLAKDPAYRPQSVAQLLEMLGVQADIPASDVPAEEAPVEEEPANNTLLFIIGGVALVVCALIGWVLSKKTPPATAAGGGATIIRTQVVTQIQTSPEEKKKIDELQRQKREAEAAAAKAARDAKAQMDKLQQELAKAEAAKKQSDLENIQREKENAKRERERVEAEKRTRDLEAKLKQDAAKATTANTEASKIEQAKLEAQKKELEAAKAELARIEAAKVKADADAKVAAEQAKVAAAAAENMKREAAKLSSAKQEADRIANDRRKKEYEQMRIAEEAEAKRKADADAKAAAEAKAKQDAEAQKFAMLRKAKEEEDARRAAAEAAARRFAPDKKVWDNSLGIKLVRVGNVLFAAWHTRVDDYETFVTASRYSAGVDWKSPGFKQGGSHPVINVSWDDAQAFCRWLTDKERKDNLITSSQTYRLPTDIEWSAAVKLEGESGATPADKDSRNKTSFPWGDTWPPPAGAGNYADVVGVDRFDETSPVGSFRPNSYGLYDMGGNAWQWCQDWFDTTQKTRVLRGGSWFGYLPGAMLSSYRRAIGPSERRNDIGFRIVLEPGN